MGYYSKIFNTNLETGKPQLQIQCMDKTKTNQKGRNIKTLTKTDVSDTSRKTMVMKNKESNRTKMKCTRNPPFPLANKKNRFSS
jgi:hypothetical protein